MRIHVSKEKIKLIAKKALSLTEFLLIEICDRIGEIDMSGRCSYTRHQTVREARGYYKELERAREAWERKRELRRLKERKLIKIRKEGDRVVAALTSKGKIRVLLALIRNIVEPLPLSRICLVTFDFPEASKCARTMFRRTLKKCGFKYLQGSVWMSEKNIVKEVNQLVKLSKVEKWAIVLCAEKSENLPLTGRATSDEGICRH